LKLGWFVLDGTNDRREYGAASATGNHLRDNAANAQMARRRCCHDRWQRSANIAKLPELLRKG
jgi:hypothetical protein